jgi:hypothetical protein
MSDKPKIDPYPQPVAMTAINLAQVNRKQAEKGRADRLRRLARRNRDVAWLMIEHQRMLPKAPKKSTKVEAK